MAKKEMLCPFSDRLCIECPLFRGRHHYLCYKNKYRGYLGKKKSSEKESGMRGAKGFEMPLDLSPEPGWLALNTLIEKTYYKDK